MSEQNLKVSVIIPVYNNALYLYETLQSLEKQTLKEFEAIVVNDGSTDDSEKIIDQFTKRDFRFIKINQKNGGVSAARNAGLDIAKGKYVTFVDGDDTLPENSLMEMAKVAEKNQSELVIGGIQRVDGYTKKVNQRTQKLKDKEMIKKDDLDLVHGLSLCNKWFLKEIIDRNHLRLEKFRHLEDGVFLYHFLQYASQIHFCDVIIYNYLKRIPTDTGSVTQRVEKGLLESAIAAFERLKELTKDYSEEFQQELAYRINSTTFIGDYYKKIWYLDEDTEKLLLTYVNEIWKKQSEDHKRRTISSHPGVNLENGLGTKDSLLEHCIFTIVLSPEISEDKINMILKSIYGQAVPAFQVILDKKYGDCVHSSFQKMKNLFLENLGAAHKDWVASVQKYTNTKYFMFLDQDVLFDYDTLAKACGKFEKQECAMLRIPIVQTGRFFGLTGILWESALIIGKNLIWKKNGEIHVEKMRRKIAYVLQKQAPLLCIKDLDQIQELTKPGRIETAKQMLKGIVRKIYKKLRSLL